MKYVLLISVICNLLFLGKILAMRLSLRELGIEFAKRSSLDTNTRIGISSRDPELRKLASRINETLASLRQSYHRYRQGDAEVRNAITNITHDLRTPLTAICGYIELAQKKKDIAEIEKYLAIIAERADYMRKLTEELFEYSVATGGEIKEDKKDVNLGRVLEECIMQYYPVLQERGIEPEVEITEQSVIRKLYPSCVERIFSNLISNALKYSDGDLQITLKKDGVLRIANTASALSSVEVGKLFDRFFTVETARSGGSHGLGLSIVKTFAERMGCPIQAIYENGMLVIEIRF